QAAARRSSLDSQPVQLHLTWRSIGSAGGPRVAEHTGQVIGGCLYTHGGVSQYRGQSPVNQLHRCQLDSGVWTDLTTPESPALSGHASLTVANRYLLLLGGWDGRQRTSGLSCYDTAECRWICVGLQPGNFPRGAGLSGHTATAVATAANAGGRRKSVGGGDVRTGSDNFAALLIGREGSLRTQRRSGNAFLLSGRASRPATSEYAEPGIVVGSRSGHATVGDSSGGRLVVTGGRADQLTEVHAFRGVKPSPICHAAASFAAAVLDSKSIPCRPSDPRRNGRRGHSAFAAGGRRILLYGGETFTGRHKGPTSHFVLLDGVAAFDCGQASQDAAVAGAVACVCPATGVAWLQGGVLSDCQVTGRLCRLEWTPEG
ncbi:hypothetical protein BOX15_Mlig016903g2, partial [Macrostomum lignano]